MCAKLKNADIWVFDSILVLLKSVLIFHHWGFYGTDSIHEKSDGHNLIFQVQMFVMCKEKDGDLYEEEITLWTNACSPSLTMLSGKDDGRDTEEFSSARNCVLDAQVRTVYIRLTDSRVSPVDSGETFFKLKTLERVSYEGCDWPTVLASGEQALPSTFEWFHPSVKQSGDLIGRCKIHSKEALP